MGGKPSKKGDPKAGVLIQTSPKSQEDTPALTITTSASQECIHRKPLDNCEPSTLVVTPTTSVQHPLARRVRPLKEPVAKRKIEVKVPTTNDDGDTIDIHTVAKRKIEISEESADSQKPDFCTVAKRKVEVAEPIIAAREADCRGNASGLDVADDEFTRLVTDAFGGSIALALASSKWDRRAEALKSVTSTVKGQRLASKNSTCFRATCLVLHRAMRDKVLPVLVESHELLRAAFEHELLRAAFEHAGSILVEVPQPEDELKVVLDSLLSHVLVKLGDSNIRLHESAKATVIFAAEQQYYGLPKMLVRLREHMSNGNRGHIRARQLNGVIDTVCGLVEHFPGRRTIMLDDDDVGADSQMWHQDDVWPFIREGLDDVVFPRTRLRAVELAVTVFSTLGRDALTPLIENLRPAVRNLLLQRFEEAEQGPDVNPEIEDVTSPRRVVCASVLDPLARTGDKRADEGAAISKSVRIKPPSTPCASTKRPSGRWTQKRVDTPAHGSNPRQSLKLKDAKLSKPSQLGQVVPAVAEHQRWKSVLNDNEEDMMDAILEDAGFVFGKSDKVAVGLDDEIEFLGLDHNLGQSVPIFAAISA